MLQTQRHHASHLTQSAHCNLVQCHAYLSSYCLHIYAHKHRTEATVTSTMADESIEQQAVVVQAALPLPAIVLLVGAAWLGAEPLAMLTQCIQGPQLCLGCCGPLLASCVIALQHACHAVQYCQCCQLSQSTHAFELCSCSAYANCR